MSCEARQIIHPRTSHEGRPNGRPEIRFILYVEDRKAGAQEAIEEIMIAVIEAWSYTIPGIITFFITLGIIGMLTMVGTMTVIVFAIDFYYEKHMNIYYILGGLIIIGVIFGLLFMFNGGEPIEEPTATTTPSVATSTKSATTTATTTPQTPPTTPPPSPKTPPPAPPKPKPTVDAMWEKFKYELACTEETTSVPIQAVKFSSQGTVVVVPAHSKVWMCQGGPVVY